MDPSLPMGVAPAVYIDIAQKRNGKCCALCLEELRTTPQLLYPLVRANIRGNQYCNHVYTPTRSACFYWNSDGSTFVRRVDGSAEYTSPRGFTSQFPAGRYASSKGIPYLPGLVGEGPKRARCEQYYERLFQLHHPYAETAPVTTQSSY